MGSVGTMLAAVSAVVLCLSLSSCALIGEIDGSYSRVNRTIDELNLGELGTVIDDDHDGAWAFDIEPTRTVVIEGPDADDLTESLIELGWTMELESTSDLNGPVAGPDKPRLAQTWSRGPTGDQDELVVNERKSGDEWTAGYDHGVFAEDGLFLWAS